MTIVDAIKTVLQDSSEGMTSQEIYNKIVERKLYAFGAKTPEAAVHAKLRVYCRDLDFPSSSPTKYFYLKKRTGKTNYYALINPESKEDNFQKELIQDDSENEMLAEEKIERAYELHVKELEDNLIERILQCKPEFFERLVVELLMKMGYGYDRSSGSVVGKSHDGGVDGIINEDKLGLSKIYIQAKRYAIGNNVGSHDTQAFVGAMQKAQKGVFITTSDFTKEAKKYVREIQNGSNATPLRLINGHELAKLMIQYEVGLEPVHSYTVYRIEEEYFDDCI
ncbi:MAG: restriction endonuclease [Holdemanella biformis]|nr:restriction endonuclease [Holdemanella biformis]